MGVNRLYKMLKLWRQREERGREGKGREEGGREEGKGGRKKGGERERDFDFLGASSTVGTFLCVHISPLSWLCSAVTHPSRGRLRTWQGHHTSQVCRKVSELLEAAAQAGRTVPSGWDQVALALLGKEKQLENRQRGNPFASGPTVWSRAITRRGVGCCLPLSLLLKHIGKVQREDNSFKNKPFSIFLFCNCKINICSL